MSSQNRLLKKPFFQQAVKICQSFYLQVFKHQKISCPMADKPALLLSLLVFVVSHFG